MLLQMFAKVVSAGMPSDLHNQNAIEITSQDIGAIIIGIL